MYVEHYLHERYVHGYDTICEGLKVCQEQSMFHIH